MMFKKLLNGYEKKKLKKTIICEYDEILNKILVFMNLISIFSQSLYWLPSKMKIFLILRGVYFYERKYCYYYKIIIHFKNLQNISYLFKIIYVNSLSVKIN